jgi:glutaredoxin
LFPKKYLKNKSDVVLDGRLRPMKHEGLPTYEDILNHPFLQLKKKVGILRKIVPKKTVATPKQKPTAPKVKTASAIRRAKAVLEKEAAKKALPPKRPGIAVVKRSPTVKQQVQEIEKRIKAKTPVVQRPNVFINKNGDLKIDRRKCRLYKKEELVKMFKLDPKLTKEQMCKFIKICNL